MTDLTIPLSVIHDLGEVAGKAMLDQVRAARRERAARAMGGMGGGTAARWKGVGRRWKGVAGASETRWKGVGTALEG